MKLLVIVLCLLSERYLTHKIALNRFCWFGKYSDKIMSLLPKQNAFKNPWIVLAILIAPCVIGVGLSLLLFKSFLYGLIGFIIQLAVFYYCLGPNNSFYPLSKEGEKKSTHQRDDVSHYFSVVNNQLFGVIFWYIVLGPLALLIYRLVSLSQAQAFVAEKAKYLTALLDWMPARITILFYLLVGNFQRGYSFLLKQFLAGPEDNEKLLTEGALLAMRTKDDETIGLPQAESLVEHATVAYLVLIALFTIVSWL